MKKREPLPYDDLRWRPIAEALQRRREQIGSASLAMHDLATAIKQGRIRCLGRAINPVEVAPILPGRWEGCELCLTPEGLIEVRGRLPPFDFRQHVHQEVYLLIWWPDVEGVWPTAITEPASKQEPVDQGGARAKLPQRAATEIRRRIGRGEVKFAPAMAEKYPGVMTRRSWQRHIRDLRKQLREKQITKRQKATKPVA
jgi:hypothetical protein